jgi:hypothetical protein
LKAAGNQGQASRKLEEKLLAIRAGQKAAGNQGWAKGSWQSGPIKEEREGFQGWKGS